MNKRKEEQLKRILQAIKSGEIVNDGKLPTERELERHFSMSRLHIRECLNILEAYGVLEIRERQGIFVESHDVSGAFRSLDDFQSAWAVGLYDEISEVRRLVEVPAARLAAQRRTSRIWNIFTRPDHAAPCDRAGAPGTGFTGGEMEQHLPQSDRDSRP